MFSACAPGRAASVKTEESESICVCVCVEEGEEGRKEKREEAC